MDRKRFIDFRTAIAATPWSAPVGLCVTDLPALAGLVNLCQERLVTDPVAPDEGWWGTWAKMAFNVSRSSPTIVTPREVARAILLDVCKVPVPIRNDFWEYLEFGRGIQPSGCSSTVGCGTMTAYEREIVPTLEPFLGNQKIRVYPSDPRDVGKTVIIQGADTNGVQVTHTDAATGAEVLGEEITLGLPFVDSVNVYGTFGTPQKDVTFGIVTFHQVDQTTLAETGLSKMAQTELTGQYRQYFINGLPNNCCNVPGGVVQVSAQCKLDLVPVVADSDYLLIQSIPALLSEAQCVRYESMENKTSAALAAAHHQKALTLLFGQLQHFLGNERPAIRVPIFGSDRLKLQPI